MMSKHGWTYKKLGEVTTTINGLWTGKKPPFVNVAVVRNTNFTKDCKLDMRNVAFLDVEQKQYATRKLYPGDIIIEKSGGTDKQPVGRPVLFNISDGEYSFSNFTSTLRINTDSITSSFLHKVLYAKYLQGVTFRMQSKTTGIHNLDFKAYKKLEIPVPPMAEQEAIVAELDEINEAIAALQQQITDLDTLAQSTFYDMFGDPVTNPKGWDCYIFSDCIKLSSGQGLSAKHFIEGKYPVYGGNGIAGYHNTFNLSGENIIIGRVGALCGNVRNVIGDIFVTDNAFILSKKQEFNNIFLTHLLSIHNLRQYAREAMQPVISNSTLKNIPIILPPLALQQEFAAKVEAIETAKTEMNAQIAEMQTLLASRMDYYFD